jgi:outer membrane biosynthesis protein TonB
MPFKLSVHKQLRPALVCTGLANTQTLCHRLAAGATTRMKSVLTPCFHLTLVVILATSIPGRAHATVIDPKSDHQSLMEDPKPTLQPDTNPMPQPDPIPNPRPTPQTDPTPQSDLMPMPQPNAQLNPMSMTQPEPTTQPDRTRCPCCNKSQWQTHNQTDRTRCPCCNNTQCQTHNQTKGTCPCQT